MISNERKSKVEKVLRDNNIDVTILWDTAFHNKSGNDYKVTVVCNKDGDASVRDVSTIAKGCFKCQTCLNDKYSDKLAKFNFKFISLTKGSNKTTNYVEFECNVCKERRTLSVGNVISMKEIKCYKCRENEIVSTIESKGCSFVNTHSVIS